MTPRYTWTLAEYRARLAVDPFGYPPNFEAWPDEERTRCLADCARFQDVVIAESDPFLGRDSLGYFSELEEPEPINGKPFLPADMLARDVYEAPGVSKPKMVIEWFSEAADSSLKEPANPLIEDLLDEGALSVNYGDSGSGKTFAALDMGFHVGAGLVSNGKKVRRGLVVYVAAEGGKRIKRRIAALKKSYHEERGADAPEPLFALVRYPIDLRSSDADLSSLLALVRDAEKQTGEKCAWLIVDTLSRAMAGGDENSPVDMGRIVASADRFRAETGAHFTYVHHTGKDAARGARGHSLLRAATDTEIETTTASLGSRLGSGLSTLS